MENKVVFEGFTFDRNTGELRKNDRLIKLNPQPAAVLALLVSRPGEIVSRETIKETLWEDETFVDFELGINSCVRQIRAALGDDASRPRYVQTIPKKGYRFLVPLLDQTTLVRLSPSRRPVALALAVVFSVALVLWIASRRTTESTAPARGAIAVLPFDNLSGDDSLDWMRLGLPELLVTSLSQRPELEVLPMAHVYEALHASGLFGDAPTRKSTITDTGRRLAASTVLHGTFVHAGDTVRIQLQLYDEAEGDALETDQVEARSESEVFTAIDELSRRAGTLLGLRAAIPVRSIGELTTGSTEAYRLYIEAMEARTLRKWDVMVERLESAVAIDPVFAEALTRLSLHYFEGGLDVEKARRYAERAMEFSDRLPNRTRYEVEGRYYSFRQETWDQAVDAYKNLMTVDPFTHFLGNRYRWLERHDECIEVLEGVRRRGDAAPSYPSYNLSATHNVLASCYGRRGNYEEAEQVLQSKIEAGATDVTFLVDLVILTEDLDRAEALLDGASASTPSLAHFRWVLALLHDDPDRADAVTIRSEPHTPQSHWLRWHQRAVATLHRGDSQSALENLKRAVATLPTPHRNAGLSHNLASHIYLTRGEASKALESARLAQAAAPGNIGEWDGLFAAAVAYAVLGDDRASREAAERLGARTRSIPAAVTPMTPRRLHHLNGLLLQLGGEGEGVGDAALRELESANALLPARGHAFLETAEGLLGPAPHVPLWYDLAVAREQRGDVKGAERAYRRIVDSTWERVPWPIHYARSLYALARIHEGRGDLPTAVAHYRRFYELWKDGDLDREKIGVAVDRVAPSE